MGLVITRPDGTQRAISGYVFEAPADDATEYVPGDDVTPRPKVDLRPLLTEVENTQGLTQIAEKLLAAIHMPCNLTVDAVQVDVCLSASIGISVFPQHGATARDLIRSADKAMYRAKAGKTSIALHDAVSPLVQADP